MKVTILGSGAALPDPKRMHSAFLITVDQDHHYLLDCGHGATHRIVEANVDPAMVNNIFLSHLHHDHCSDYPYFVISTWMCNRDTQINLFGPKGTRDFSEGLLENGAFKVDIEARSAYPKRQSNMFAIRPEITEIEEGGLIFDDGVAKVYALPVDHIPPETCVCFAFKVEANGKSVVFSSDTTALDSMVDFAKGVDVLIHDTTFPQEAMDYRKDLGVGTFSHSTPREAGRIAQRAGAKRLVANHIVHYDNPSPVVQKYLKSHFPPGMIGAELLDSVSEDIKSEYDGHVLLAHDLMRIDI
ncbi:MBL fold metallo-hydrolase [Halomonas kalidii]|uniref:MBL fold metallo-hydrolase n=1 Tax=Halomonas kalidii TaxID=3043293 RepID=A0ABT6VIF3_9GAMM|nr:MBL fold metallo-hydrolase [Halomonas kalidii]MDI5932778.1 MBL fold metallo-hydrolase [Halomonas kalidii]